MMERRLGIEKHSEAICSLIDLMQKKLSRIDHKSGFAGELGKRCAKAVLYVLLYHSHSVEDLVSLAETDRDEIDSKVQSSYIFE